MKPINFVLTYEKSKWTAENREYTAIGKSLEELDKNIKNILRGKFKTGEEVKINMEFDYNTIPFWMRQYHPYYIHRSIYMRF